MKQYSEVKEHSAKSLIPISYKSYPFLTANQDKPRGSSEELVAEIPCLVCIGQVIPFRLPGHIHTDVCEYIGVIV